MLILDQEQQEEYDDLITDLYRYSDYEIKDELDNMVESLQEFRDVDDVIDEYAEILVNKFPYPEDVNAVAPYVDEAFEMGYIDTSDFSLYRAVEAGIYYHYDSLLNEVRPQLQAINEFLDEIM